MEIGEEIRTIRIEPAQVPIPRRVRTAPDKVTPGRPKPKRDPVPRHDPATPDKEPAKVPERT